MNVTKKSLRTSKTAKRHQQQQKLLLNAASGIENTQAVT